MRKSIILCVLMMTIIVLSSGCAVSTQDARKSVDPMFSHRPLQAATLGVVLSPNEYGVEELGTATATAYQVRKNNGKVTEGDNVKVVMTQATLYGLQLSAVSELQKVAIARAIDSIQGGEAFFVTSIETSTKPGWNSVREDVTVKGRVLALKSLGTLKADRVDKLREATASAGPEATEAPATPKKGVFLK